MANPSVDTAMDEVITSSDTLQPQSAEVLQQVESMLDYIRANLKNISCSWGVESPQYRAASEIMQDYFNENIRKLNIDVQEASLGDLLAQLSLDENTAQIRT